MAMKTRNQRQALKSGLALLMTVMTAAVLPGPGWAMIPPMMSVQVSPGSTIRGLASTTADGLGVTLSTRQSTRTTRRSGTKDASNPDNEQIVSWRTALLLDYRVTRNLTALLSIPHVYSRSTYGNVGQTTEGLGDIAALGKYSLYRDSADEPTRELLGIAGVKFPSGSTSYKDGSGARYPATQQAGSGTTDFLVGGGGTWGLPFLTLYGDLIYKINGNASYSFGNSLGANLGAIVPIPRVKDVSLLAEFNGEFVGRDKSHQAGPGVLPGGTVRDTGGETIYFSPALQFRSGSDWAVTTGVQIPIAQNFRGTQLKSNLNYTMSLHMRFFGAKAAM